MAEKYLGHVISKIPNNDDSKGAHALLKIIAIKENGCYRKLSSTEADLFCPPNGEVFAPQFFNFDNSDFYDSSFVEFETRYTQKTEKKVINQTDFIINYTPRPKAINLSILVPYQGKLNQIIARGYLSPDEINDTIDKKNVLGEKNTRFFLYDSIIHKGIGIFKFQSTSNTIESNFGKNVQEFTIPDTEVVSHSGKKYLLMNEQQNTLERGSMIDFMTNQQLADWFKSKMKTLASIDKNTLSLICSLPESQSAEDDKEASRFERLKAKKEAFDMEIETLVDLICTHQEYFDQFVDNIELIETEVREKFEKKYIIEANEKIAGNQELIKKQEAEISKLEETLEAEKNKILSEMEQIKAKLENENQALNAQVEEKQAQLKSLNENYDSIIATISAVVPVLKNTENTSSTNEMFKICNPPFYKDVSARPYSRIKEEDEESFISFLKRHVCYQNDKLIEYLKQIKTIFSHKACFIPNIALAFLFAKALRNTEVVVMHIEHDWLHYSDFVKHGLVDTFRVAYETPEKNYILVLDGLNITQPECGLRPLLNLINGDIPILEGCGLPFPNNITVMATVLSTTEETSIGLKLNPLYFHKWYAVGNPAEESDRILLPENFWDDKVDGNYGYAEPRDLPKKENQEKAELLDNYLDF